MSQPLPLVGAEGRFGHMPFTDPGGVIAGTAERFGYGHAVVRHRPPVTGFMVVERHASDTGLMLIQAGQERCTRRTTAAGIVEMSETQAVFGQLVQIRCLDLPPVTTDVGEAEVVCQNHQNIGAAILLRLQRRRKRSQKA